MPGSADRGGNGVPSPNGDPRQPHDQREIAVANLSNDELVNIINGSKVSLAKGMPVLIVPSCDGRLAAVAVNGLQILVPTTTTTTTNSREDGDRDKNGSGEGKHRDFRDWLLLMASLAASVSYTAGLAPPGGFWGADDKANGYVAGNPVLRDKAPASYLVFYYGNSTAFVTSLLIIAMLSNPVRSRVFLFVFNSAVMLCFLGLGTSYISATGIDRKTSVFTLTFFSCVLLYALIFGLTMLLVRRRAKDANNQGPPLPLCPPPMSGSK